jgi:hypothetical protein
MAKKPVKKKASPKTAKKQPVVDGDSIKESYDQLKSIVSGMEEDVLKFADDSVASAGRRLRASSQEIRLLLGQYRKDIQALVLFNRGK